MTDDETRYGVHLRHLGDLVAPTLTEASARSIASHHPLAVVVRWNAETAAWDPAGPAGLEALETDLIWYVRRCVERVVSNNGVPEGDPRWLTAYEVMDVVHTGLREQLLKHLPPPLAGPEPEATS